MIAPWKFKPLPTSKNRMDLTLAPKNNKINDSNKINKPKLAISKMLLLAFLFLNLLYTKKFMAQPKKETKTKDKITAKAKLRPKLLKNK